MRDPAQYVGEEKGGAAHSLLLVVAHEAGEGERGEEKETEGESGCRLAGCLPACPTAVSACFPPFLPLSLHRTPRRMQQHIYQNPNIISTPPPPPRRRTTDV